MADSTKPEKLPTCFIAQPFDSGKFDKRYTSVVKPIVERCQLLPHRIDEHHEYENKLDAIESGITAAETVFVDITMDNPNVWLELGMAKAMGKPLVLACCENERPGALPFDIRVNSVCYYRAESPPDFEKYAADLENHVMGARRRAVERRAIAEMNSADRVADLSPHEIAVLSSLMEESPTAMGPPLHFYSLQSELDKRGYTEIAASLAVAKLGKRGFVTVDHKPRMEDGETYFEILVTLEASGIGWMLEHEQEIMERFGTRPTLPPTGLVPTIDLATGQVTLAGHPIAMPRKTFLSPPPPPPPPPSYPPPRKPPF